MKTITVVTHDFNEIKSFFPDAIETEDNFSNKLSNDVNALYVYERAKGASIVDMNGIDKYDNDVILFHINGDKTIFKDWQDKSLIFDVGTHGNDKTEEGSDRFYYEKLLNANNNNNFDWNIFDEVWDYFWNKAKKQSNEKKKTDFLFSIYDGCIINGDLEEKLDEDLLERIGKNEAYQFFKSGDISYDKNNVEHVQKLTQLRDLILES